jgi:predicted ATPase/class 3 adenylate cyclase
VEEPESNSPVIMKMLNEEYPTPLSIKHFYNEFDVLKELDQPGVRKVLKQAKTNNRQTMFFEYVDGETIKSAFSRQQVSLQTFLRIAIQIADILERLHTANIIHKDVSGENILVSLPDEMVSIIDFGISTRIALRHQHLGNPERLEGNLSYISPEQTGRMNRVVDYRTDLYSLGVVFYEALAGCLPFQASDAIELVHCHIAQAPTPLNLLRPELPDVLWRIVQKLLAKNADERYQSALGLKRDLQRCLDELAATGTISSFEVAENDYSGRFQLRQKLYGREDEIERLMHAFERVSSGPREMMLVGGYSGTGKSALVHEIHNPITQKRGYFIEGKFDQFQRIIPYYAILHAFKEYVTLLLTEHEDLLAIARTDIQQALGEEGKVLTDVIPNLEFIIGKQPEVPELGGVEAQNRFNYVFRKFVRAIASERHPVVLFIDDLQWADAASLSLIEILMTDSDSRHFLCICAYRDNEVSPSHPFIVSVATIESQGTQAERIEIGNLSFDDAHALISESLNVGRDVSDDLTQLVFSKTNGNAFFVNQFLRSLYEQELLHFDFDERKWKWEIERIKALNITDNVVELMTSKIRQLADATQETLKQAACIGSNFDLDTLAIISDTSKEATRQHLYEALAEGLVIPLGDDYKFAHDRIQFAVYSLIPEEERASRHLRIGKLLLEKIPEELRDGRIFDIVNQLNVGIPIITDQAERERLAKFNLQAGRKAKLASAYKPALDYFTSGMRLLQIDCWKVQYPLALDIYTNAADAAYLNALYDDMEGYVRTVINNATKTADVFRVYETLILGYIGQNELRRALDAGLEVLGRLRVVFPKEPTLARAVAALLQTKIMLRGRAIESVKLLPPMSDINQRGIIRLLSEIAPPAYWMHPNLLLMIIFKMMRISLRYGNVPESYFTYAAYGMILCELGEYTSGYQFGCTAIELLNHPDAKPISCKTTFTFHCFIIHWKEHLNKALAPMMRAYHLGLETGDMEFGSLGYYFYCLHSYFIGTNLDTLATEIENARRAIVPMKQETTLNFLRVVHQAVLNLRGESADPCRLVGAVYDEREMLPKHIEADDKTCMYFYYLEMVILNCLFGRYTEAVEFAARARENIEAVTAQFSKAIFPYYESLIFLGAIDANGKLTRARAIRGVRKNLSKLKRFAKASPENHHHRYLLVRAELLRVLGKPNEALALYEAAIDHASATGYIQDEALACELAGRCCLAFDRPNLAEHYLRSAHQLFRSWGAGAKVSHLEECFPQFLSAKSRRQKQSLHTLHTGGITTTTTSGGDAAELDLATILKASTAISGEIVLSNLLSTLMKIVVENVGAQKGYLLFQKEGELFIEAELDLTTTESTILSGIPLAESSLISESIIQYVVRTKENLVIADAALDETFSRDQYIIEKKPKSVLCAPILRYGDLMGILYFENNLAEGAFTDDRIELLQLLSGQIAVSIDNALLYDNLEQKVQERTAELAEEKKKSDVLLLNILPFEIAEELKAFGKAIPKRVENVTVLFSDIKNFTQLAAQMHPDELVSELDTCFGEFDKIVERHGVEKIKTIGDSYMCVGGLPASKDSHAIDTMRVAWEFKEFMEKRKSERIEAGRLYFDVRIGLHSGPVVAGVVGTKKFAYDIWGDTVNTASRMETASEVGRINISETTYFLIRDSFKCTYRGKIAAKNKGDISMYFVDEPVEVWHHS